MDKLFNGIKEFLKQSTHNQVIVVLIAVIFFGYRDMSEELDRKYENNSLLRKQLATNDSIYSHRINVLADDYQTKIDKCTEDQIKTISEQAKADREKYDELYQTTIKLYNKTKSLEETVKQ